MRYLSKYKLFLEEAEETSGDVLPEFDSSSKFNWEDQSSEIGSEESKGTENNQKDSGSNTSTSGSNSSGSGPGSGSESGSGSGSDSSGANAILTEIFGTINDAYEETSSKYYFRPYAVSAWTSFFSLLLIQDKEKKACDNFFGQNVFDKNSWWYGNVTSKMFVFIKGLKEAIDKKSLDSLKKEIDELPDTDKTKNYKRVGLLLLTQVHPKLKEATLSGENSFKWIDPDGVLMLEIDVVPDFGVGDAPSGTEYKFATKEEFAKELKKCAEDCAKLDLSGRYKLYDTLEIIVKMIDGLFKSTEIWKTYKHWYGDEDSNAAAWVNSQKVFISNRIFSPLIIKMNEQDFGSDSAAIRTYYTKQINRIKTELLDEIIKKMKGSVDAYDIVEFKLESFDKKKSVYVEVDTDF
jgi:hypothetical protein